MHHSENQPTLTGGVDAPVSADVDVTASLPGLQTREKES